MRRPMATELTQVAVGDFDLTFRGTLAGTRLRDVTPRRMTAALLPKLGLERDHLNWLRTRVGPHPFESYGSLVVDAPELAFALETQTLVLYPESEFTEEPRGIWEPVMVHETAHE